MGVGVTSHSQNTFTKTHSHSHSHKHTRNGGSEHLAERLPILRVVDGEQQHLGYRFVR